MVCVVVILGICFMMLLFYHVGFRMALIHVGKQMDAMEGDPESNRQLKVSFVSSALEALVAKMNQVYRIRQEERIRYLRRENQIRMEIENISHDLRTPLTSLLGYIDLMQDVRTTEVEREEYLQIMYKRAKILQGFIQEFYELSRLEGDDYPFVWETIHVQNTLSEVLVAYYNEFEKRNIKVDILLHEIPCYIIADQIQMNRVLNNLIQNALKYTTSNFTVRQCISKSECIIQLENDIDQMCEEELNEIFNRFYTNDPTRNTQSTGLGLTISKLLTEKMMGSIQASLKENIFTIELRWRIS